MITAAFNASRICLACEKQLPVICFSLDKRTGKPRSRCKACRKAENAVWRADHPDYISDNPVANRARVRRHRIRKRFGIDAPEYDAIMKTFGPCCQICGKEEKQPGRNGRLSLDHDHATGRLRGAICSNCNLVLGLVQDDPHILAKAIEYLQKHGVK
jgi:hypothetical protein